ncbi:unnamed protein product, partial [Leptidea sinapis]
LNLLDSVCGKCLLILQDTTRVVHRLRQHDSNRDIEVQTMSAEVVNTTISQPPPMPELVMPMPISRVAPTINV